MLRNYFFISVCSIYILGLPFTSRMDGRDAFPTDSHPGWPGCIPISNFV